MFSSARKRVTYANVAATLALLFAMSGGAYAAGKYLITSTKQISPNVLKQLKGKNGKAGKNGANGATGPQGPAGPEGKAGATGKEGPKGAEGPAGPEGKAGAPGKEGPEGPEGPAGPEGVCSTSSCHLPTGVTETGHWALVSKGVANLIAPISFAIPLEKPLGENEVHYVEESGNGTTCPGSAEEPKAAQGNLCVYVRYLNNPLVGNSVGLITPNLALLGRGDLGANTSGALVYISGGTESEESVAEGTWAVTG